jgi:hypothetical protein
MSCSGIHCAGCGGGVSVPVIALVALEGFTWVAAHVIEVAVVAAACGALSVAAVVALMRWSDRRDARHAAAGTLLVTRVPAAFPAAGARPAIGPVYNFNFYGPAGDTHAAIIRKAITGPPGDAAIEGK